VQVLQADWRARLPRIEAPTLVLWGEHDGVCPPAIGREIVALTPGSRLVVIPGAAHSPMWERSADFDREVLAFLSASRDGIAEATRGSPPPEGMTGVPDKPA
jgi:pimeloyl-ACP methyl ester carboxylesterase